MDRVKAIKVLKPLVDSYVDYANISMKEEDDDIVDALEMAIEALKALDVPDMNVGDMISRQMAIDALFELYEYQRYIDPTEEADRVRQGVYLAEKKIEQLPSVQPELTDEQSIAHLQSSGWMQRHDKEIYKSGLKEQLADDSDSYDSLLPSVHPDHVADISKKVKGDCIGRQMAIDALDIAIERYDEIAEKYRKKADIERNDYMDMRDNAYEAQQLAQWLNELKYLREKIEQITIMPEPRWIPCSERLPSETVIATVETKPFKHRYVCEAVWIPRWTRKVLFDEWEDCSEYKEDDDEYYALEGWYERVYNWDEYAYVAIDDNVIAWLPLTKPYGGGDAK